jgi:nitroreductase
VVTENKETTMSADQLAPSAALAQAARRALNAPSVFNTQPWIWHLDTEVLELSIDPTRQLEVADPDGRLLTISCGTALHHARTALTAAGYDSAVERLPDSDRPYLLARIRVAGHREPSPAELALSGAIECRRTDRRAFGDKPVPGPVIDALRAAAAAEGANLHLVREDQMPMLAVAVLRAGDLEVSDPGYRSELIRWTNRPAWSGDGVPAYTAVRQAPRPVPVREFALGHESGMDAGPGSDRGAAYTIVFGDRDDQEAWLRAGEALSALLLTATAQGLSASPISDVVEVGATRELLRGLLSGIGHPYLAVRFGYGAGTGPLPRAPRREPYEVIDVD